MTEKRSCWPKFLRGIFDRYNSYMNKGGSDPPPNFAVRTNLRTQKSRLRHCYATATLLLHHCSPLLRHCYAPRLQCGGADRLRRRKIFEAHHFLTHFQAAFSFSSFSPVSGGWLFLYLQPRVFSPGLLYI